MDDGTFYYLRAEDRVPRDAVRVVVGGAVTVVPPGAFRGCERLATAELREGVAEIGSEAFANCPHLERVDCPSTLVAIGARAFAECGRLSEVILREGLEEIGSAAFFACGLERIAVPSSVVEIGDDAFHLCGMLSEAILTEGLQRIGAGTFHSCDLERITVPSSVVDIGEEAFAECERLSEVNLKEGLRRIGAESFRLCALEQIAVPSSVVEIGEDAFQFCTNLEEVTLAGGMAMVVVARGAFDCPQRIAISSVAIVVEATEDGDGTVAAVTGGIEWDHANESPKMILASPHLASMPPEDLTNLTDTIYRVADTVWGVDLAVREVSDGIRGCFVDHLSTWYSWYKREVATILELGLWKIELGRAREANADVPTRDNCRRTCGADPIVGLVLSSLAGPHRRADREE